MSMKRLRHHLWSTPVLVILFVAAGVEFAQAQTCERADAVAIAWLEKMSHSIRRHSYHGVVTLQRGEAMQVMQVSHLVKRGESSEQLIQLTGQGVQVNRKAHPLECLHPGDRLLRAGEDLKAGRCGLADQYRFRVDGVERIAGRPAVRISVEPRDMYRHGYRLALDRETGLLLKTETYGQGGAVLEKFQYANLAYGDSVPGTTSVDVVHHALHPHPEYPEEGRRTIRPWQVAWLPGGFARTDTSKGRSGRQSFTDGLAVFSVFLEEFDSEIRPGEGVVREGGTISYTRGMRLDDSAVLVTVIGEVPVNTARMVADSLSWVD